MSERLPDPDPARFPDLTEEHVRVVPGGTPLGRIHRLRGKYPSRWDDYRTWGPGGSRFDPHGEPVGDHPGYGVLYCAVQLLDDPLLLRPLSVLDTCLAACFQPTQVVDTEAGTPYFTLFAPDRPLRLLDVSDGPWVTRAGGNAALTSGRRVQSRKWARAIFVRYTREDVDGIWYSSSVAPASRAAVLWERSRPALPPRPQDSRPLADPALRADLEAFAARFGWDLQA